MTDRDDGGPAFPQPCDETGACSNNEFGQVGGGMTLRDYFAAKAMQAYLALDAELSWPLAVHADSAYKVADAMLQERAK